MSSIPAPPDLNQLMERLRAEVAARRGRALSEPEEDALDESVAAEAIDPTRRRYHVRDFLYLPNAACIRGAFRAVLGRDPTAEELAGMLDRLRLGQAERLELVAELHAMPEAVARGARIAGLRARLLVVRLRTNRTAGTARAAMRLLRNTPRLAGYMRQVVARVDEAERKANDAKQRAAEATSALLAAEARLDAAEAVLRRLADRLDALDGLRVTELAAGGSDLAGAAAGSLGTITITVTLADLPPAERAQLLADCRRALRPGGMLVLAGDESAERLASALAVNGFSRADIVCATAVTRAATSPIVMSAMAT